MWLIMISNAGRVTNNSGICGKNYSLWAKPKEEEEEISLYSYKEMFRIHEPAAVVINTEY